MSSTQADPFRSVDALDRKRHQINLSKTHCELQKLIQNQNATVDNF